MNVLRSWLRGFHFAAEGLKFAAATQRNMKFHLAAASLVFMLSLLLPITDVQALFVLLAVMLVISMELMNTAVEQTVDLAMPSIHPVAKIAKDAAAAAVLVSAVFAVGVGVVVFAKPLLQGALAIGGWGGQRPPWTFTRFTLFEALLASCSILARAVLILPPGNIYPSALASWLWGTVAMAASLGLPLWINALIFTAAFALTAILALFAFYTDAYKLRKQLERSVNYRHWSSLLLGAALGAALARIVFVAV